MRRLTVVILAAAIAAAPLPAEAYLKLGARAGTRTVTLKWPRMPIRYSVTDRGVSGVTSLQFQQTMTRAFATWAAVHQRAGLVGVRRLHVRVAGAGRRRHGARLSESSRHGAHARRHVLPDRHDDRRHRRVRHLLQLVLPVVRRGGGADERLRSRVDCRARDRAPARAGALGASARPSCGPADAG